MRRMDRLAGLLAMLTLAAGCSPELGDAPFACGQDSACPDGYTCQSTVCVREGERLPAARPKRVTWINAAEMYWAEAEGGATLVVNDGFTPSAHGIYEIQVHEDGQVDEPKPLYRYGDEFPIASAVVVLADGRYGVATRRFPNVESDDLVLEVLAIERETPEGKTPVIESLYTEKTTFLGGSEPPYIGATTDGSTIDLAFTEPTQGGLAHVLHLERSGSVWKASRSAAQPLPPEVLPLSGDSLLWRHPSGAHTLRVGFEEFAIAAIDAQTQLSPFISVSDLPLYAFDSSLLLLRKGASDVKTESYAASFVLAEPGGKEIDQSGGWILQDAIEPYTAVPYQDGALIAPLSKDPAFPSLGVGLYAPGKGMTILADIKRPGTDRIYSARAYASGGKVYLAWTEFHESLMDLWIAVADASAAGSTASAKQISTPTPRRLFSWTAAPRERRASWSRP